MAGASQLDIWRLQAEKESEIQRQEAMSQLQIWTDVFGTELEKQLLAINMKADAYRRAGFSELETTRLIEQQKTDIIRKAAESAGAAARSAFMSAYGGVVGEVQEAILSGQDAGTALDKAMEKYNKRKDAERTAIDMVGNAMGIRDLNLLQSPDPMVEIQKQIAKYYEAMYTSALRGYPEQAIRGNIDASRQNGGFLGGSGPRTQDNSSSTYSITVNVSREPGDNEEALANKVAKRILDEVTKYSSTSRFGGTY